MNILYLPALFGAHHWPQSSGILHPMVRAEQVSERAQYLLNGVCELHEGALIYLWFGLPNAWEVFVRAPVLVCL